jgi:hypothetical protein
MILKTGLQIQNVNRTGGKYIGIKVKGVNYKISSSFITSLKNHVLTGQFVKGFYNTDAHYACTNNFSPLTQSMSRNHYLDSKKQPLNVVWAILGNGKIKSSKNEREFFDKVIFPMMPKTFSAEKWVGGTDYDPINIEDLLLPHLIKIKDMLKSLK